MTQIEPSDTLSDLATRHAGASRVFWRHELDFCCHGRIRLDQASARKGLDVVELIRELEAEIATAEPNTPWNDRPLAELTSYLVGHFHRGHREELPRLLEMASRVERVHADKPSCPAGLAAVIEEISAELELHMQKEEQILFPLIEAGEPGPAVARPIRIMEAEHDDVATQLRRLRTLTGNFTPPEEACGTWRALFLGLAEFELDLMQHVHLENHVLFPRALTAEAP